MKAAILHLLALPAVFAWPNAKRLTEELEKRQRDPFEQDSYEMIGDLRPWFNNGQGGPKTDVGWTVWGILNAATEAQGFDTWKGGLGNPDAARCLADRCCIWRHIALDMEKVFRGQSGRCTGEARAAIRLGFHDAGTWSKFTDDYGGADGSIILSGLRNSSEAELKRPENNGLQHISDVVVGWYDKYKKYGIGMADLIQMAANVATVVCPLGPRVRTFVGRIDSNLAAVNDLLPDVNAEADVLIKLFEDKTIRVHGLTALVGAHTTSQQHFVNTTRDGDPQDSTPGVWDVAFYSETTGTAPQRVFKFPSDVKLSRHPLVSSEWGQFAQGQSHWNSVSRLRPYSKPANVSRTMPANMFVYRYLGSTTLTT